MNNTLQLPATPTVNVVYSRGGTNYGKIIPNPRSSSEVYRVMLFTYHVSAREIVRVDPVSPLPKSRR